MKTSEKLERGGWVFKEYAGRMELFERGNQRIMYDPEKDLVVSYCDGNVAYVPDAIQLELLFEK